MNTRKAFEHLFRTHYDDVCEEARRNGVPASDAEDVAQDAFLQYTQLRPRYAESPPGRLLRSIARNRARNFRRKERWRKPIPLLDPSTCPTPEEAMRFGQGRALMARVIRELPEPLRRVYVLADIEGMRLSEVAKQIGVPLGTVKSRLHTARAAIDAILERLARSNELPAVLWPLLLGREPKSWVQRASAFMRPLTVGVAACFLLPHIPGDSAQAATQLIVAPLDAAASADTRPVAQGTPAGEEPSATEPVAVTPDAAVTEYKVAPMNIGIKAPRRERPSDSNRREFEIILLQDVQNAYDTGNIDGAQERLQAFDRRYPAPYLSQERDRLAARIELARSAGRDKP